VPQRHVCGDSTFYDPGNQVGATSVPLTISGSLPPNTYTNTTTSVGVSQQLYSLTQVITIPGSALVGGWYSLEAALLFSPAPPPVLGFASSPPRTSRGLALSLQGTIGVNYRVDASSDLLNWTTIASFTSTNAVMSFLDPSAINYARRFYRAVGQ
jgi:hypothetical protein